MNLTVASALIRIILASAFENSVKDLDIKLWIQKIGQLNIRNCLRKWTSKMETEKQKFLISFQLRWKIRWPKSCGTIFFNQLGVPVRDRDGPNYMHKSSWFHTRANKSGVDARWSFYKSNFESKISMKMNHFWCKLFFAIFFRKLICIKKRTKS